jgi:hypothetical protein
MNRITPLLPAAALALALAGCGGSGGNDGGNFNGVSVSGTVTLDGQPLEAGLVTLTTDDGKSASAQLDDGGVFTMANAPTGRVKIGVNTQMLRGEAQMDAKQSKRKGKLNIREAPARYIDPKTSGLSDTVEAGKKLDIKLTGDKGKPAGKK